MSSDALTTEKHQSGLRETPRHRKFRDRSAKWIVTAGGLSAIAAIFGILLFIGIEVLPLFSAANVEVAESFSPTPGTSKATLVDEYRTLAVSLHRDGRVTALHLQGSGLPGSPSTTEAAPDSDQTSPFPVPADGASHAIFTRVQAAPESGLLAGLKADGSLVVSRLEWKVLFDENDERQVSMELSDVEELELADGDATVGEFCVERESVEDGTGALLAAAQLSDSRLVLARSLREENDFTGEVEFSSSRDVFDCAWTLTHLALNRSLSTLYASSTDGRVIAWHLRDDGLEVFHVSSPHQEKITAMSLLAGGESLAIGRQNGSIEVWFRIRSASGENLFVLARTFQAGAEAVTALCPSPRNRSFLSLDSAGNLALWYSTSERLLWSGASPIPTPLGLTYAPKGDGALVIGADSVVSFEFDNPHPEVSMKALFGKVWYEGYSQPEHVWQSSGGSAANEPKLSLTPLLFGTIKGTIYSLILAIPLGVFAALYTSQFLSPGLQKYIKPTVEIMAALPTVILGFLAGLWLAPRMEEYFPAILLFIVLFFVSVALAQRTWNWLPTRLTARLAEGTEALWCAFFLLGGAGLSILLSGTFESLVFGGDFGGWLNQTLNLQYDQRNAIVVGLAMGFAVIPIVFSISEEAFSSVPKTLIAGSLALGATRWQTVAKIVLPSGSPGVFAAVIVGFGRAVGETMVVLMATGNTPIVDGSPFNGFRTMSANIAVEIPEAPVGGTLYRTLFLSGLILFVLTFVLNTVAEIIRLRLRKKYGQL